MDKINKVQDYINNNPFEYNRMRISSDLNIPFQTIYNWEDEEKIFFFSPRPRDKKDAKEKILYFFIQLKKYYINKTKKTILEYTGYKNIYEKICEDFDIPVIKKIIDSLIINQYGNLILFHYGLEITLDNNKTVNQFEDDFWKLYDGFFMEMRSIVLDLEKDCIVLLPQKKFMNLNQCDGWMLEDVESKIYKAKTVEITNKLDGSNQNYRYYNGKIIGSGSQSLDPEQSYRLKEGYGMLTDNYKKLFEDYSNYTFMFEFISPETDPHVVCYTKEQRGLYLFGMRDTYNGKELSYDLVLNIGKSYNVKTTEIYYKSLHDIMLEAKEYTSDEKEGWVINIIDYHGNNFKVKLKTDDYLKMHKLLSKLTSSKLVVEAIAENQFDDFLAKVPVGHRDKVNKYAEIIFHYVNQMEGNIRRFYHISPRNDKKTFMIWVDTNVPKKYNGYVKSIYLGKEYNVLKRGTLKVPSYKNFNDILKEEGISLDEEMSEE